MASYTALVVTVVIALIYPIYKGIYNSLFHPLSSVPGPPLWAFSRLPFINHLLRGTLVQRLEQLHRLYGPIVRIAPGEVTFAHPDAWTDILQPRAGKPPFLKDSFWWGDRNTPNSINKPDPLTHARIRRTLTPAFSKTALRAQEPIVMRYVTLLVSRLREQVQSRHSPSSNNTVEGEEDGESIDIFPWLNFVTFDIFGDLGYGESFNCLEHSQYHPWVFLLFKNIKALAFFKSVMYYPMLSWLLNKCIPPSMAKIRSDHFQLVVDKVNRRMNWEVTREDVMSHTIREARNGKGMTLDEINHTFGVLTIAGSETTATALGGTLNYLSANPDVRRRVVREVRAEFISQEDITLNRVEERCTYLTAVLKEGLRLCPPLPWILPRVVPEGGEYVCGLWLPGGTIVSIQQYTINRSPEFFHDADAFIPERWLPSAQEKGSVFYDDKRDAVHPFSVGPRACLGQNLAWAELRLVLACLLWAFDIEEKNGGALRWEDLRTFLLVEKRPIVLKLKERRL